MRLLVLFEKNFNRYFSVPTDKDLHRVCVKILKERLEANWYNPGPKPEELAPEFLNNLPQGRFLTAAMKFQEEQRIAMVNWKCGQEFMDKVLRTIKIPAKEISWKGLRPHQVRAYGLLVSRRDAEFEGVQLDETEN